MRVYVNREDIKKAEKSKELQHNRSTTCPVARAVKRKIGRRVSVSTNICKYNRKQYALSESAQQLVHDFDDDVVICARHVTISDTPLPN